MVRKIGKKEVSGVGVLMITPLKKDYSLNEVSVRKEVDWLIDKGANSLWPSGYIGEWPSLDEELRTRLFKICVEQANGKALIAAGCHATNLNEVVRLVNSAEKVGCDLGWICAVTPRRPTDDEIVAQYQYILDRTSLPIGLYNSTLTGVYMTAQLLLRICSLSDRIVAVKDSVGDFGHIAQLYHVGLHKKVSIFPTTHIMIPSLIWGAAGALPDPCQTLLAVAALKAFKKGEMEKAWALQFRMTGDDPLLTYKISAGMAAGATTISSSIGAQKAKVTAMLNIEMGPPAPPYAPPTAAEIEAGKKQIEQFKLLDP